MNFKGFKKHADDGKIATFRHESGHEMKVVKHVLDRKTRAALDRIPLHEPENEKLVATHEYAEGGQVRQSDPSLESETPDVTYVGGKPYYQGKLLAHPLAHQNVKADEANRAHAAAREATPASSSDAQYASTGGKKYAEGGDVVEDPTAGLAPETPTATDATSGAPAAPAPAPQPPVTINITNGGAPQEPAHTTAQKIGQVAGQVLSHLPTVTGVPIADVRKGMQAAEALAPTAQELAEGLGAGVSGNPLPPSAPAAPAVPSSPMANAPASAEAPVAAAPLPSPAEAQEKMNQQALGLGLRGLNEQATAEKQLATERAGVLHAAADQSKSLEAETHANLAANLKEIEAIKKDIAENLIKPKSYSDVATAGPVRTIIGMILGGIGGGTNPVMAVLDRQIERDLESQKKNLDEKNNLLSALLHREGDIRAASDLYRSIRAATVMHQLDEAAAKAGTPLAQARADQAKSALMQQYAPLLLKASLMKAVSSIAKSGDVDAVGRMLPQLRLYDPAMAKEMESRYVPGVGVASVPIDQKTRDRLESGNNFLGKVRAFRTWAKAHEGTVLDRAAVNYGQTLAADLQSAYRQASNGGVFKESEAKFIDKLIPSDPTAFFNSLRVDPKLKAVEDSAITDLNSLRKSIGLPTAAPTHEIVHVQGVPYAKVNGGLMKLRQ